MTLDDYIKVFRDECQEHLPWEEARDFEALFATKNPRMIFDGLEKIRNEGRIPTKRFEQTLTEFYWQFGY